MRLKRKMLSIIMTAAMITTLFAGMTITASAYDGTASSLIISPGNYTEVFSGNYSISNQTDMEALAGYVEAGKNTTNVTFTLTTSFELDSTWTGIGDPDIQSASTSSPYVDSGNGFDGILDGNNKTITLHSLSISESGKGGVVNYLAPHGIVKNLTVIPYTSGGIENEITVTSSYDAVGGVVGYNAGRIYGVTNRVTIAASSASNVGGITGFNDRKYTTNAMGYIYYCSNSGAVTAQRKAGGIAGENAGYIAACSNSGTITNPGSGKNGAGGITGRNGNNNSPYEVGIIRNCYNTGAVSVSSGKWGGGIAGFQSGGCSITNCYSTVCATGNTVGYIVGNNEGTSLNNVSGSASGATMNVNDYASGVTYTYDVWNENSNPGTLTYLATGLGIESSDSTGGSGTMSNIDEIFVNQASQETTENGSSSYPYKTLASAVAAADSSTASSITIKIVGTYTFAASTTPYQLYGNLNSNNVPITTIQSTVTTGSTGSFITVNSGATVYLGGLTVDGTGYANTIDNSGSLAVRNQAVITGGTTAINVNAGGALTLNRSTINAGATSGYSVKLAAASGTTPAATCTMSVNTSAGQKIIINGKIYLGTGTYITTTSSPALMLTNTLSVTMQTPSGYPTIMAGSGYTLNNTTDRAKVTCTNGAVARNTSTNTFYLNVA